MTPRARPKDGLGSAAQNDIQTAIEAVWRIESSRLIGGLARLVRDLGLAEDLAQEALVSAMESWPGTGIPQNPGAWLMTTAKHRALDVLRRQRLVEQKHQAELGSLEEEQAIEETGGDDLLRLVLISCHPVLSKEARVALTLKLVAGLTTDEIARAFLLSEVTLAQRIVRAKRTLTEAQVPFEVPSGEDLKARVPSVLEVIYLIFNEGYAAAAGEDWMRPALCQEAMRLGRTLTVLVPDAAEVHGLVALMELQASRMRTRVNRAGEPILLLDQDRGRWDHVLIQHGLGALRKAASLAQPFGPYTLQAAIAACHARARTAAETDWERIVALYDALVEVTGSPVAALNRAVAVSMVDGPAAGLELVDELVEEPALAAYHLLPATRAHFLSKLGQVAEARSEYTRAAELTQNARERDLLLTQARSCEARREDLN